jgi:aminopeptidase YwaD
MDRSAATALKHHLDDLCLSHPDRHVGGAGNRAANALFRRVAEACGFEVETTPLPCLIWERGPAQIEAAGQPFELQAGPYSPAASGVATLAGAESVEAIERGGLEGQALLLHGELTREQLMPKNFTFYNPPRHQRIVAALEAARPLVVLAATGKNPELAGGLYPFPLIEDGDFELPSAFLTDMEGARLLEHLGEEVTLSIESQRHPAETLQLVARKNPGRPTRVVFFAHIDSKDGTPGALDNGTGVVALLGLAELLRSYQGPHTVELVPLNGEDYYAATGQMHWLERNRERMGEIVAGFNVDGAGFRGQQTAVSLYGCPAPIRAAVEGAMRRQGFVEGPQWPQGDHSLLVVNEVPAVAVTSENVFFIGSTVAHTDKDRPELVDIEAVAAVARFFADALEALASP